MSQAGMPFVPGVGRRFRVPVATVARLLSGDAACAYRAWEELRRPRSREDAVRMAAYAAGHAREVRRVVEAHPEARWEAERPVFDAASGLSGRADLVDARPGAWVVHEVKTGQPRHADVLQTMVYVAILRDQGHPVAGGVLHRPDGAIEVDADAVPPTVLDDARALAERLKAETPPPRVAEPSCAWCPVTACASNRNPLTPVLPAEGRA